jgi:tRNA/rRNA methyltransferase
LARVRVVLVRPENPVNIGAVARVARNTGLAALDLVNPGDWRTLECWRTAWGAQQLIEGAGVFQDLGEAVAGSHYCAAFSGKAGGRAAVLDVREMAEEVSRRPDDEVASLVFGPERTGLTDAELALCGRRVLIPTHPRQPSLNLSHAVMVAAYELFRAARDARHHEAEGRYASHGDKSRMLALLREGLSAIRALPARNHESDFREWEAMFQRADLTPKELRLLEHMARKMIAGAPPEGPTRSGDAGGDPGPPGRLDDSLEPYGDVRETAGGFSIPRLKWRELLFVGALRAEGDTFVRDPGRPLPAFRDETLFAEGIRLEIVSEREDRVVLARRE